MRLLPLLPVVLASASVLPMHAQKVPEPPPTLKERVAQIARESDSTVSVACALPNQAIDCGLNIDNHAPMQSVFKFPLGLTVLHMVEQGKFTLDQQIRFLPADRILPTTYSPLQDKYPQGNADVPLRELLRLSVMMSDNVATDILLRLIKGPAVVQAYMESLGIKDIRIVDDEQGLHDDAQNQFRNWMTPAAAVKLLRLLADASPLSPANTQLLEQFMVGAPASASRIKAGVPPGTTVWHKTGSSGTVLRLTYAYNDIGLIVLPDGRTLALAVFLTNSTDDAKTRDATIAAIAKAAYEAAIHP